MYIYPNGKDGKSTHISLSLHYLALGDEVKEGPTPSRIYAEFVLRLIDRHKHKNLSVRGKYIKGFKKKNETHDFLLIILLSIEI